MKTLLFKNMITFILDRKDSQNVYVTKIALRFEKLFRSIQDQDTLMLKAGKFSLTFNFIRNWLVDFNVDWVVDNLLTVDKFRYSCVISK